MKFLDWIKNLFSKKKPETVPPPVVKPPSEKEKTIEDWAKESYPVKGWDPRYDVVIASLLKKFPVTLPCEPVLFLKAIISAESNFNNASRYMEPPPLSQYSIGLFQLSLTDARIYGGLFKTEKEIENPILNIDCAIKIMNKLQFNHPAESPWESLGRYWSVCRWDRYSKWKGKNQAGFKRVREYLRRNGVTL